MHDIINTYNYILCIDITKIITQKLIIYFMTIWVLVCCVNYLKIDNHSLQKYIKCLHIYYIYAGKECKYI